jgi:hypothetical protein
MSGQTGLLYCDHRGHTETSQRARGPIRELFVHRPRRQDIELKSLGRPNSPDPVSLVPRSTPAGDL